MKWLAVILLVANIALWCFVSFGEPANGEVKAEGRLPRVSALQVVSVKNGNGGGGQDGVNGAEERSLAKDDRMPSGESSLGATESAPEGAMFLGAMQVKDAELCIEIGWFEDETSARDAARDLDVAEDIKAIRAIDRPQAPFHWVIVPPASSRAAANQRYREIRSMGVDAYLVARGERENSISLGLFESLSAAERILARRKSQGLDAKLVTFPRNRISYALVFSAVLPSGAEAGESLPRGYESRFESVKFSECEGVATTDKNP
ncbi:MAG: hypothetical protein WD623_12235 [Marinobacter sp.]|uniref:hypothetical protein n=1 Tax=Marinobacter sp. TaxID=50741 RepID=UPI00349FF68C